MSTEIRGIGTQTEKEKDEKLRPQRVSRGCIPFEGSSHFILLPADLQDVSTGAEHIANHGLVDIGGNTTQVCSVSLLSGSTRALRVSLHDRLSNEM